MRSPLVRSIVIRAGLCGRAVALFAGLAIFAALPATAALKNWDGSVNGLWSTAGNWTPAGAPANGDILNFPAAANLTCTNDLAGRRFDSLNFSVGGYVIRGNGIVVTNGIVMANGAGSTLDIDVTLGGSQTFANSSSSFFINGVINLGGFNLAASCDEATDLLTFGDRVTGTGTLNKTGLGVLRLTGTNANDYVGLTTVTTGTLRFLKTDGVTALPGDLFVRNGADVVWFTDNQAADAANITLATGALLDLNGQTEAIAGLTATSATVDLGGGTLTLGGNVTVNGATTIVTAPGTLSLGSISRTITVDSGATLSIPANLTGGFRTIGIGILVYAGFTKEGLGTLTLSGTNTYGGGTAVNAGRINANSDTAFGVTTLFLATPGGVSINDPTAFITLNSADIGNKSLVINDAPASASMTSSGVSSWSGPITLNTNAVFTTGGTLALSNSISGSGGLTLASSTPAAVFRFAGTNGNDFAGDVLLRNGTLELAKPGGTGRRAIPRHLTIGDPGDGASDKFVRYFASDQITANITINCSSQLDLNDFFDNVENVTMAGGNITTGAGYLRIHTILTVLEGLSPCGVNIISGRLAFGTLGPDSIRLPVGSLALGAPDLFINAVIFDSPELRITGNSGRVFLNGANTFNSLVRLESTTGGLTVRLNNPNALGSASSATILNGVQLELGGFNFAAEPMTNINAGTIIRTFGNNLHAGPIVLNADLHITNTAAITELAGAITGANFDVTKTGTGTLRFSGASANTFGTMFANQGLFEMNKSAGVTAASPLIIGDGMNVATARSFASSQTDEVTVNRNSLWDLNGNSDAITPLVLDDGGDVTTGAGTLSFGTLGSITVTGGLLSLGDTVSTISGNLNLGASGLRTISVVERSSIIIGSDPTELVINAVVSGVAGFNKTGTGDLSLTGANTFAGNAVVSDGELLISNDNALGGASGDVFVNNDAQLSLSGDITVATEMVLNSVGQGTEGALRNSGGANVWSGTISLIQTATINVLTNTSLTLSNVIIGAGGVTKIGPGRLEYTGAAVNTYSGATTVNEGILELRKTTSDGSIPGTLVVGDGTGGAGADVVRIFTAAQIEDLAAVTVNSSGLLEFNLPFDENIGSLAGSGRVALVTAGSRLDTGFNNANTVFSGVISGVGGLRKEGAGTLALDGFNTHSGATTVAGGTLLVNGGADSSAVTVLSSATLGGTGGVGALNVNNLGNVSPGTSPGALRSRNTVLSPGSNFRVEINGGTAGAGYDQLNVDGTINLNGALLFLSKSPGFAPADGQQFVILDNDVADAVVGTFGGRPEGSLITIDGIGYRLSYAGGTGNDVTLTVTNFPARFASSRVEAGNGNGRIDPNECDHLFVALENRSGSALSILLAQLDCLTPGVAVSQGISDYPNIPALGFGTNTTPFQIRVAPNFQCGQNIDFNLVLFSVSHGFFSVPFTLNSGGFGAFTTFNSTNIPKAVPDLGTTNSVIILGSGFRIGKARVSVHATHPAAGDLRLRLVSPTGTEVLLAANRGGNAANYGSSCAARTTFDDDAATKITAGSAPFAGTFAPEENLSAFTGELSTGTWRLFVDDTVAGDTGTLQCWSLLLAPAACSDGGGECESCLASVAGTLTGSSPTMDVRLSRNGITSGCGNDKDCPGTLGGANPIRYAIHEFTNSGPASCVTVMLNVPCAASTSHLQAAAYLTSFNPSDLCANYLGDSGTSIAGGSVGYSFQVAAGAKFIVVVNEINQSGTNQGCGNYTLDLYGLPCPPPTLHIARDAGPDRVRLFWSTAYPGFRLQRSATLNGTPPLPFVNVPGVPFVIDGDYNLTNSATANDDYFRLRKP